MRIWTPAGDLAFKSFTFPDGQPHFKLETHEIDFRNVTIESAIRNPSELFMVLLASEVLRREGYNSISLDIRYLLAARMDRAISVSEPFTLDLVARLINGAGFSKIRILDAHSDVATRLIRNSENVLPFKVLEQVHASAGAPIWVCPDKGAQERVSKLGGPHATIVYCTKHRDPVNGNLSNFEIAVLKSKVPGTDLLIVDDICDGGGTFVGLAKVLRQAGARSVNLFVTHGIFSKGLPLEGIDRVFTTDSYNAPHVKGMDLVTIIPVSMKEMR